MLLLEKSWGKNIECSLILNMKKNIPKQKGPHK